MNLYSVSGTFVLAYSKTEALNIVGSSESESVVSVVMYSVAASEPPRIVTASEAREIIKNSQG